jgi:hypothetical protein
MDGGGEFDGPLNLNPNGTVVKSRATLNWNAGDSSNAWQAQMILDDGGVLTLQTPKLFQVNTGLGGSFAVNINDNQGIYCHGYPVTCENSLNNPYSALSEFDGGLVTGGVPSDKGGELACNPTGTYFYNFQQPYPVAGSCTCSANKLEIAFCFVADGGSTLVYGCQADNTIVSYTCTGL